MVCGVMPMSIIKAPDVKVLVVWAYIALLPVIRKISTRNFLIRIIIELFDFRLLNGLKNAVPPVNKYRQTVEKL